MNIVILHNAVASEDSLEDQDTLTQVAAVSESLGRLGHRPIAVPCTLDLAAAREKLLAIRPAVVVNLVESLGGSDSLVHLAASLLDTLVMPYTGNPTEAIFTTSHKLMAKRIIRQAGLPTPNWMAGNGEGRGADAPPLAPPCIIKAVWEHGSRGLDDENVVRAGDTLLVRRRLAEFIAQSGRPHFAEEFIDGREFNVALLDLPAMDGPEGPQVLPIAEMDFSAFPEGKPRIIGHRAKWHEGSFEFRNTTRTFRFHESDRGLIERLRHLALDCWQVFGLRGYARVDFRVDAAGRPSILEINANPCLSPDAGYAAAAAEAGLTYDEVVERILDAALAGRSQVAAGCPMEAVASS